MGALRIRAVATETELPHGSAAGESQLAFDVQVASSPAQLLAAAHLRSYSFYTYPEGRSAEFADRHRRMRAQDECDTLHRKLAGDEPGFRQVACLVALCAQHGATSAARGPNPLCQVVGHGTESRWVAGTLDVNQGPRLPGEELIGQLPKGPEAEFWRAYVSNVCVEPAARRRGVAAALLESAQQVARQWGVEVLYVHVVADNLPAKELYEKSGFRVEQAESASAAHMLARPRRLLLRKRLDIAAAAGQP